MTVERLTFRELNGPIAERGMSPETFRSRRVTSSGNERVTLHGGYFYPLHVAKLLDLDRAASYLDRAVTRAIATPESARRVDDERLRRARERAREARELQEISATTPLRQRPARDSGVMRA